ncbi:MAG TPA: hypothetical protein VFE36_06145, partial [Candidatus Baltobacteraceae bacterium]|nr:hypothetical protein [Candidatus Baltobacteraceae bacterium]
MHVQRPNGTPSLGYIARRFRDIARPRVDVSDAPGNARFIQDAQVPTRDGTILRVNLFLPPGDGPFPTIACAHPYGKDAFPKRTFLGYEPSIQYRTMRQPQRVS